jgi:hypothetical protein
MNGLNPQWRLRFAPARHVRRPNTPRSPWSAPCAEYRAAWNTTPHGIQHRGITCRVGCGAVRDVRYTVQWKGGERGGWARMRLCEPNPGADVAGYTPASSSFTCWMIESISDGLFSPKYLRGFAIACNMQCPPCNMPRCNMQNQRPTCNMPDATCQMQHAACCPTRSARMNRHRSL